MNEIYNTIAHREPFLFIDSIEEVREKGATAKRTIRIEEPQFQGHYPGNPIMPGVLLCEAVFQTAAVFLAKKFEREGVQSNSLTPILSRINEVKFKQIVRPGDVIVIDVELVEKLGQFFIFKGSIRKEGKLVLTLQCILTMINESK